MERKKKFSWPDKNDTTLSLRLPGELLTTFSNISEETNDSASGLIRLLMENWIESYVDHGKHLIYPPEFNYFPHVKSHQEDQMIAAEEPDHYQTKKNQKKHDG